MTRFLLCTFYIFYTIYIGVAQTTAIQPDEAPIFGNCNVLKSKKELYDCSISNLTMYLNTALHYPTAARENNIQGRVKVQFTIDSLGKVGDAKLLNDIGSNCGTEALRVITSMPTWKPARYKGKAVTMYMTMPVNFILSDDDNTRDYSFNWGVFTNDTLNTLTKEQLKEQAKIPIIIRDANGNIVPLVSLMVEYNMGTRQKEMGSNGTINEEIQTLFQKAKSGSTIKLHVFIARNTKILQIDKVFLVK
jgi:TonB family protein